MIHTFIAQIFSCSFRNEFHSIYLYFIFIHPILISFATHPFHLFLFIYLTIYIHFICRELNPHYILTSFWYTLYSFSRFISSINSSWDFEFILTFPISCLYWILDSLTWIDLPNFITYYYLLQLSSMELSFQFPYSISHLL